MPGTLSKINGRIWDSSQRESGSGVAIAAVVVEGNQLIRVVRYGIFKAAIVDLQVIPAAIASLREAENGAS